MGWWRLLTGSGSSGDDALAKLDPELRAFLEKESPAKYAPPPPPTTTTTTPQDAGGDAAAAAAEPRVPAASLFPDGRYAHLWRNYRPLAQVETESASDHDKLMGVLEGHKGRKAVIGRVALENCALQQEEWVECLRHGCWQDQVRLCIDQRRRFEKCYAMQSRFLRALGYGSVRERSPEADEDMQMHADALYQRVLAHEAAVERARADGAPAPAAVDIVLPRPRTAAAPPDGLAAQWRRSLDGLPADERAAEEAALHGDRRQAPQPDGFAALANAMASLFGRK